MRSPRSHAAALAVLAALVACVAPAVPSAADTTPVPGTLSAGVGATVALDVPVPAGVAPVRVRARLTVDAPDRSTLDEVRISAGDRLVATVPPTSGRVSFRVRDADVTSAGVIPLRATLVPRSGVVGSEGGCPDLPQGLATLEDIKLVVSGREAPPRTVADFLSSTVRRVDVAVARDAGDDLLGAALHTITAVGSRYGAAVGVQLVPDGGPARPSRVGDRVIRLVEGPGAARTAIALSGGVPTLTITGTTAALRDAATALTLPELGLADRAETSGLAATPSTTGAVTEVSLAGLGAGSPRLAGYGRVEQQVRILQDAFGGAVDSLHVTLRGTHSAVPAGVDARFDTYVNGTLLDSVPLGQDDALEVDVAVPTSLLGADNNLVLALSSTPPQDRCGQVTAPPIEVALDPTASRVSATHGEGPGGFVAYPQAFAGQVPVVFGGAADDHWAAAADAASLLAALQRQAVRPLTVSVEELDDVLGDAPAALLLHPSPDEAETAELPLLPEERRTLGPHGFAVEVGAPFAALEASRPDGGTRLLTLVTADVADGSSASSRRLAEAVARAGWNALAGGDVYVVAPGGDPASYDSGTVGYRLPTDAPTADEPADADRSDPDDGESTLARQLVGIGIAVLFVACVVLVGVRIARNRRGDATG